MSPFLSVSRYTRESGVRSLERKLGSVCRAVAVKVAEHQSRHKDMAPAPEREEEVAPSPQTPDDALIDLPPEMPIVIDKHAVKDILGVSSHNRVLWFEFADIKCLSSLYLL